MSRTLFASLLLLPTLAFASLGTDGKPKVAFFATGSPGFLDIEGDSSSLQTTDDGTSLTFTVPMSSVTTGIGLRDSHMNDEYVQVASYPNAVLKVARGDVKWPTSGKSSGTAAADFNIHGQSQTVSVTYTVNKTDKGYKVSASFPFDCAKSGIQIPSYLGVTVDPKMRAEVTVDLVGS